MEENAKPIEEHKPSDTNKNNLFDLAKNLIKNSQRKTEEKNLIIIGDKGSGKSTLFNSISQISMKSSYTPTCGINYSYMRYQPSSNKKLILNIYEIGGGLSNVYLNRTILNERNIRNTIFVINLDLSKPRDLIISLKNYLKELSTIIKDMSDQETILETIENKKLKYKDTNSNDFKRINIFPSEVIVVGNNYESFEVIDLEKIKWTCRCLRFFCHLNSLSLVYFKKSDPKVVKMFNNLITSMAFSVNGLLDSSASFVQKNEILPLYIVSSFDSFIEIGEPKVFQQGNKDISSLWEDTLSSLFTRDKEDSKEEAVNDVLEQKMIDKYKEPRIDEELKIFEKRNENQLNGGNYQTQSQNQVNSTIKKGKSKKVPINK